MDVERERERQREGVGTISQLEEMNTAGRREKAVEKTIIIRREKIEKRKDK